MTQWFWRGGERGDGREGGRGGGLYQFYGWCPPVSGVVPWLFPFTSSKKYQHLRPEPSNSTELSGRSPISTMLSPRGLTRSKDPPLTLPLPLSTPKSRKTHGQTQSPSKSDAARHETDTFHAAHSRATSPEITRSAWDDYTGMPHGRVHETPFDSLQATSPKIIGSAWDCCSGLWWQV